jgi:peroxiredoxin
VATSSGTYSDTETSTYIVTVTRGGLYADSVKPQITVSKSNGTDVSGPTTVTAAASAVVAGSLGVQIQFSGTGLRLGDIYYIPVTGATSGAYKTILLGHNMVSAMSGASDLTLTLYFYPKAFTQGCTVEAHQFAEATDKFAALGTTVVGMSNDSIDTLKKFSTEACRDKFAVLADAGGKVIKDYDSALKMAPSLADRVSYLIGTDGKIAAVHAAMDPDGHISTMLKAAEKLGGARK